MSSQWMFNSFNMGRFHSVFGKASDQEELALQKVLEFEMGATPEDEFGQIANKIAHKGINYQGLNPRDAEAMDQVVSLAIGPEGLWGELEMENESGQPLSSRAVEELLKRAEANKVPVELLPALKRGRRFGSMDLNSNCNYVIFDRAEVTKLAQEIRTLVDLPKPWSSPAMQQEVSDGLLFVFEYVTRKKKSVAGVLNS